jgi:stage II sporulation protein D
VKYRFRRRFRRRNDKRQLIWLLILFPCALFLTQVHFSQNEKDDLTNVTPYVTEAAEDMTVSLLRTKTGVVEALDLETYVIGVVAAEMPVNFEGEALKAQAVIARTYALRKMADNSWVTDPEKGDLCDDSAQCQAYYDTETLKSSWGNEFDEKFQKISTAVTATKGMILMYDGEIARTFYCSTCGGQTASAKEVWGTDYPYLQSVVCKWDKDAPRYEETVEVALSDLPWLLGDGASPCIAVAAGEKVTEVPITVGETESGRIQSVTYAGLTFSATSFRTALGLNSTHFNFDTDGDMLEIETTGYGHGVGLCQYGANGMAAEGYHYEEILSYYYEGTELTKLQQ